MYKFKGVKLNHSNPVIAAKTYHIPKKSISFTLDNNSGTTETIYFIAAHEPDLELEQLYKEIKIAQQHDETIQTKLETSKILQKITQNKTISQPQYMVEAATTSGFMEICDKCIKVLSFRHE
jgi:FlaG/FlaF family flagellin (archaellin)